MDYLISTILWVIISVIGYVVFWKDWKSLNGPQQWFIIFNSGVALFAIVNYFLI